MACVIKEIDYNTSNGIGIEHSLTHAIFVYICCYRPLPPTRLYFDRKKASIVYLDDTSRKNILTITLCVTSKYLEHAIP